MKRTTGFDRVGGPLQRVLRRIDPERRIDAYRLFSFWDEIVGEQIARRAQPARISNDVLFVTVSSHTWMQELQFLKDTIRERVNERLGAPLIKDIFLVSGRVKRREPEVEEAATPPPVALPDLPSTGDPRLDASLQQIARATAQREAAAERKPRPKSRRKRT